MESIENNLSNFGRIYNTKDKSLYGNTTQEVTSAVDSKDNKEEVVYRTNIMYKMDRYKVRNRIWMFHM